MSTVTRDGAGSDGPMEPRGERRHVSYVLDLEDDHAQSGHLGEEELGGTMLGNGGHCDDANGLPPPDGDHLPSDGGGAAGTTALAASGTSRKQKMQAAKSSVAVRKVGKAGIVALLPSAFFLSFESSCLPHFLAHIDVQLLAAG